MELLKIRENKPYKDRNENVEFLRDWCCLFFNDELKWELYLNGEIIRGEDEVQLSKKLKEIIALKNKRIKKDIERRLVIWTNELSQIFNVIRVLSPNLQYHMIERFVKGERKRHVDKVYNSDLEFRNFNLIAGENVMNTKETYGFKSEGVGVMIDFLKKREDQGLKGWGQIRYTAANNNLKLFYKRFNAEDKKALYLEGIKRIPSYEFHSVLMAASKKGVMIAKDQYLNKMLHNVYSYDISSAYNSQFIRGDDFPLSQIKRTDTSNLLSLYKENKWFLLVMRSEEKLDNVPQWIEPYEFEGDYYYVIGNYDYKAIKLMGGSLSTISKEWTKYKLFTCEKTGRLNDSFRKELNSLYEERQYLKKIGSKEEKISKQIAEVLYGKGIQKRDFKGNDEIQAYYKRRDNAYINGQISFHALQRTRYEIILMLDRLNWSFIACDTDSIKTQNPIAPQVFEERNREIREENKAAGFESKIGLWKFEGLYPNFYQYGNKVYAYELENKIKCVFAGCLTDASERYFSQMTLEEGLLKLNDPDLTIPDGIIQKCVKLDDNKNFYLEKKYLGYRVRGEIK